MQAWPGGKPYPVWFNPESVVPGSPALAVGSVQTPVTSLVPVQTSPGPHGSDNGQLARHVGSRYSTQGQPCHVQAVPLPPLEPSVGNWHTPPAQTREPQHWAPELQSEPSYQQQRESQVEAVYSQIAPVWGRLH